MMNYWRNWRPIADGSYTMAKDAHRMTRRIIRTGDGSHSIYVETLEEHYHSVHGAIRESMHVFIRSGLAALTAMPVIRVFEMGFGTGLNAWLTWYYGGFLDTTIEYTSLEAYPLSDEETARLNYPESLPIRRGREAFQAIHRCPWGSMQVMDRQFSLHKVHGDIRDERNLPKAFDLVYYDAFAPTVQPELWTQDIFGRISERMLQGGVLVTYCAKGSVRRALKASGLVVERIPGPPGKREMIRAWKR